MPAFNDAPSTKAMELHCVELRAPHDVIPETCGRFLAELARLEDEIKHRLPGEATIQFTREVCATRDEVENYARRYVRAQTKRELILIVVLCERLQKQLVEAWELTSLVNVLLNPAIDEALRAALHAVRDVNVDQEHLRIRGEDDKRRGGKTRRRPTRLAFFVAEPMHRDGELRPVEILDGSAIADLFPVEAPWLLDADLLRFLLLHYNPSNRDVRAVKDVTFVDYCPLSPWQDASLQSFLHDSAHREFVADPEMEFPQELAALANEPKAMLQALTRRLVGNRRGIKYATSEGNLLYLLRWCKGMAPQNLEGRRLEFTLAVSPSKPPRDLLRPVADVHPIQFLTRRNRRDLVELVQGVGLLLSVDPYLLQVREIQSHVDRSNDLYRGQRLRALAKQIGGVVLHVINGYVEVYSGAGFELWHNGERWLARPFRQVEWYLSKFFDDDRDVVERFVAAFTLLLEQNASSIVAFVPHDAPYTIGTSAGKRTPRTIGRGGGPLLDSFRPLVQSRLAAFPRAFGRRVWAINENVRVEALVGWLSLDGAHFISQEGGLLDFAVRIHPTLGRGDCSRRCFGFTVDSAAAKSDEYGSDVQGGSGAWIARELAGVIPSPGFVVKVSASGDLRVYQSGESKAPKPLVANRRADSA